MISYYNYTDLHRQVEAAPTQENIAKLVEWFDFYDADAWNGEVWDADSFLIRPVYAPDDDGEYTVLDRYELMPN